MRILMLRLKGYSGISSGMLRDEITIDFSNAMHKICLIKGATGSGKSTILEAITPLPNDNSMLDPTQQAEKEIVYNNGIRIFIIHPLTNRGERATTKAYIYENEVNLNPNGNVTSFKDIVFEKLELDSNFEALSKLSTRDRGLADKTPAIRKKYVSSIIDSVEVYNNIYKNLTNHSKTLKSMLQSIVAKMDSIGDEKSLDENIKTLEALVKEYEDQKEKVSFNNASAMATIRALDPDGSIISKYNELVGKISDAERQIQNCLAVISKSELSYKTTDIESTRAFIDQETDKLHETENLIQQANSEINNLIETSNIYNQSLMKELKQLESITDDNNYDTLVKNIAQTEKDLRNIETFFDEIRIHDAIKLSSSDYSNGVQILQRITDDIKHFFSLIACEDRQALFDIGGLNDAADDKAAREMFISDYRTQLSEVINKKSLYESQISIYDALNKRPSKCKIDDCPFISNALSIGYDPNVLLKQVADEENDLKRKIQENSEVISHDETLVEIGHWLNNILTFISGSANILSKLPGTELLLDEDKMYELMLTSISCDNILPNFSLLYDSINKAYMFDAYKTLQEQYQKMLNQKDLFDSKHDIIEGISLEIDELRKKLNDVQERISEKQSYHDKLQFDLGILSEEIEKYKVLLTTLEFKAAAEQDLKNNQVELNKISYDIDKIRDANATIAATDDTIKEIKEALVPVQDNLNRCKYNKQRLKEYEEELAVYNERFEKTEVVKQYTSPTKEGIQLLFMEMYMNNILSTANNLLSKVFNGQFMLQPFIINGDEFRIPCVGNKLMNDDISSMSTGQICMISMILSFSILYNSSSKYNIIKLDEIDGGFDTENRSSFINILNEIIDILGCQQCFLISHNEEIQYSATDMILLRTNSDNRDYGDANIIYDIRNN